MCTTGCAQSIQFSIPIYGAYPVIPVTPRGYPPGYIPPYVYGSPSMYERPQYVCEGEQYIDGNYNPPASKALCRGRVEREMQYQRQYEHDAYERGRRGLR
jgi:hypothetical protein